MRCLAWCGATHPCDGVQLRTSLIVRTLKVVVKIVPLGSLCWLWWWLYGIVSMLCYHAMTIVEFDSFSIGANSLLSFYGKATKDNKSIQFLLQNSSNVCLKKTCSKTCWNLGTYSFRVNHLHKIQFQTGIQRIYSIQLQDVLLSFHPTPPAPTPHTISSPFVPCV